VTLIAVSGAPIEKLAAYRRRMGWNFTWASSYRSDFNADGLHAPGPTTRCVSAAPGV
jgi:predicted dithiol-disulfide oxidoreductase (DUF899 family)